MNSFTWLYFVCLIALYGCGIVSGSVTPVIFKQLDEKGVAIGDGTLESSRQDKTLFKTSRVSPGNVPAFTHPWQLMTSTRNRLHSPYWNPASDEDFFLRHKRKFIKSEPGWMSSDQSSEPVVTDVEVSTISATKEESTTKINSMATPRSAAAENNMLGFRNKISSISGAERNRLVNKFWNAVYNPLPYGAPRSLQTSEDTATLFRQKQASGLPFARTATRERERERAELRLPIPDSEIPSPGHYRQPVNETVLQASNNWQIRARNTNGNDDNQPLMTVNVEAFRILMEIIKSLRDMSFYGNNMTALPSQKEDDM